MECPTCDEDSGYLWDSSAACPDCDKGKTIQYEYDKSALRYVEERARKLRKKIKAYVASENGGDR
jgi:NMD protein affecting ribosome stability and mRNA decay